MKYEALAPIIVLLIVVATGPVGAVPLSVCIIATYGLFCQVVRRQKLSKGEHRATALALAALALPLLAFLVVLWSVALDVSFEVGGAVWLGIIVSLENGLQIAARWNERQKAASLVHPLVDRQQAA